MRTRRSYRDSCSGSFTLKWRRGTTAEWGQSMNREISGEARIFRARPLFAANMIGGFWLGVGGYVAIFGFLAWHDRHFRNDRIGLALALATWVVAVLVFGPGRLFAMWPYAIALEPQKGIWVYAPPSKLWIPMDEIVDVEVYSGMYGGGYAIQLNRSHGLVREIHILSLAFSDQRLAGELRTAIDRRDGVVHSN